MPRHSVADRRGGGPDAVLNELRPGEPWERNRAVGAKPRRRVHSSDSGVAQSARRKWPTLCSLGWQNLPSTPAAPRIATNPALMAWASGLPRARTSPAIGPVAAALVSRAGACAGERALSPSIHGAAC